MHAVAHAAVRNGLAALALGLGTLAAFGQPNDQPPDVEMFDQPEFSGIRLTLDIAAPNLAAYGIGTGVASVIVRRGQWEFCTRPNYNGACITVGPGRYQHLPPGLQGQLASLRPVGRPGHPGTGQPTPGRPGGPGPVGQPALVLYEHQGAGGRALPLHGAAPRLQEMGFNDAASSIEIYRGRWQVCVHENFQGQCMVLGPGRHNLSGEFQDSITSVRPVFGREDRPLPAGGGVTLFDRADFSGEGLMRIEATPNLKAQGFNDRTVAIEVHGGQWELCADANYSGGCVTFAPGRYVLPREWARKASSLRPR